MGLPRERMDSVLRLLEHQTSRGRTFSSLRESRLHTGVCVCTYRCTLPYLAKNR